MHYKLFGGRALPWLAGELTALPDTPAGLRCRALKRGRGWWNAKGTRKGGEGKIVKKKGD